MLQASESTPWYDGPNLLQHLEAVDARREAGTGGFRLPVQWDCRPDQNFRGFSGPVVGGPVAVGDEIAVLPSGQRSRVATIVTADGNLERAVRSEEHTSELQSLMRISYAVL